MKELLENKVCYVGALSMDDKCYNDGIDKAIQTIKGVVR